MRRHVATAAVLLLLLPTGSCSRSASYFEWRANVPFAVAARLLESLATDAAWNRRDRRGKGNLPVPEGMGVLEVAGEGGPTEIEATVRGAGPQLSLRVYDSGDVDGWTERLATARAAVRSVYEQVSDRFPALEPWSSTAEIRSGPHRPLRVSLAGIRRVGLVLTSLAALGMLVTALAVLSCRRAHRNVPRI